MRNKINFETLTKINETFGEFDIGQTFGGGNPVYLRFGYWKQVDIDKLNNILAPINRVEEESIYDDDCGEQFNYKFV
jgi:hypothetical protein